jgi:hypothetical protein
MTDQRCWLRISRLFSACAALLGFAAAGTAAAADWYVEPGVSGGMEYNDNASLSSRTDDESTTTGVLSQFSLKSGYQAETSSGWIRPRLRVRKYPNDDEFDSNDKFVDGVFAQRFERSRWGFRGNFSREQVRTAELAQVGLDPDLPDIPDDDTAEVDSENDRTRFRIFPYWETQVTEKSSIDVRGQFYDVSYDDDEEDRFKDYTNVRGEVQYRYAISPVTDLITGVFGRNFSPSSDPDVVGYGAEAGFEHEFSRTTRLRVLGGIEHSEPDEGSSSDDWIADVSLVRRLQTTWLRASYRRIVSAQGDGDLSLRDQIHLGFTRRLTELLEAGIGVRAYSAEGVQGNVNDRDYAQIRTEFIWNLSRQLNIVGDYRYTILDRDEEDESANANQLFLYLQWGLGDREGEWLR